MQEKNDKLVLETTGYRLGPYEIKMIIFMKKGENQTKMNKIRKESHSIRSFMKPSELHKCM